MLKVVLPGFMLLAGCAGTAGSRASSGDGALSSPAVARPAAANFHIAFDAWTPDQAEVIEGRIADCVQDAGGIESGTSLDSLPPQVVLDYRGPDADGLEACLRGVGGQPQVSRTNG